MKLTEEEKELLTNSVDMSITNVSIGIANLKTIEAKNLARDLICKLLDLSKKINDVSAK